MIFSRSKLKILTRVRIIVFSSPVACSCIFFVIFLISDNFMFYITKKIRRPPYGPRKTPNLPREKQTDY